MQKDALIELNVKERKKKRNKNNKKLCYEYLNIRPRKRLFSREGKQSTGDTKKDQVFSSFLFSVVIKMAADNYGKRKGLKKKMLKKWQHGE